MPVEVKARKDMDKKYLWNLDDIVPSMAAFEEQFAIIEDKVAAFAKREGHVAEDARGAIREHFEISCMVDRLYTFASMRRDEDGDNDESQSIASRMQSFAVKAQAQSAFLQPELLDMPREAIEEMIADADFVDYTPFLRNVLRSKAHTLSFEQEKLLAMAGDIMNTPNAAFSMLSDVDMPFPVVKDEQGEDIRLSHAKYFALLRSKERSVRKEAFLGMQNAYNAFGATIAALYAGSVKGDVFEATARKFDSALEASLYSVEIPVSVYHTLISAVHDAIPALNDYLALRKKVLGVDALHLYDLYVPMVDDVDMKMSYEEAYSLVMDALKPLGEDYAAVLKTARDERWIDVYENKAKHSGAYSWGTYGVHPYVLLNYEPGLDGASTLAHELGHAMHSHYSDLHQPYAKAQYSLFVAEVASTVNEVLLAKYQMEKYKDDKKMLAFLLNSLLESFRTTLFRQTLFAEFELKSHAMAESGKALTKDALNAMNKEINAAYYGSACVVDDEIAYEWMRIPHFYRAFYVYQYATGFSAAVAIATRILKEGASAVAEYKKFLSAGGSVPPIEALKYAGVDMSSPVPVKEALGVFKDAVAQLKELL